MNTRYGRFVSWTRSNALLILSALMLVLVATAISYDAYQAISYDAYQDHAQKNMPRNTINAQRILICEPTNAAFYPQDATVLALFSEEDVPGAYIACSRTGECCLEALKNKTGTRISQEIDSAIDTAVGNGKRLYFRIGDRPNRTIAIYTR